MVRIEVCACTKTSRCGRPPTSLPTPAGSSRRCPPKWQRQIGNQSQDRKRRPEDFSLHPLIVMPNSGVKSTSARELQHRGSRRGNGAIRQAATSAGLSRQILDQVLQTHVAKILVFLDLMKDRAPYGHLAGAMRQQGTDRRRTRIFAPAPPEISLRCFWPAWSDRRAWSLMPPRPDRSLCRPSRGTPRSEHDTGPGPFTE